MGLEAACRQPELGAHGPDGRRPARPEGRGQPPPVVLAGLRAEGDRADHRRLQAGRPRPRLLLRRPAAPLRDGRPCPLPRPDLPDPLALRGHPGRRLGEHLRGARPLPRPEAPDPDRVPRRDLRGHRPDARRQGGDRQPDRRPADQGLGLQQPERDSRRAAAQRCRQGGGHPDRHRDRDHDPRRRQLPGMAVARAGRACGRRSPGQAKGDERAGDPARGGDGEARRPSGLVGRRSQRAPGRVRRGARSQRLRGSRPCSTSCSASCR